MVSLCSNRKLTQTGSMIMAEIFKISLRDNKYFKLYTNKPTSKMKFNIFCAVEQPIYVSVQLMQSTSVSTADTQN